MPTANVINENFSALACCGLLAIAIAAWYARSARPLFIIRFTAAGTKIAKGSPTSQFVTALEDLRHDCRLTNGRVVATFDHSGRIRLNTSANLPPAVRQRIRNLWSVYG